MVDGMMIYLGKLVHFYFLFFPSPHSTATFYPCPTDVATSPQELDL